MRKSLNDSDHVSEIKDRILRITEKANRKWGSMSSAQMLCHCDKILQVGLGRTALPETGIAIRSIGICAKIAIRIFNNPIPPNMPTFEEVKLKEICNFEQSRADLLVTLDEFIACLEADDLPERHALFGRMNRDDWGFLQYKHINHHLNQFGI